MQENIDFPFWEIIFSVSVLCRLYSDFYFSFVDVVDVINYGFFLGLGFKYYDISHAEGEQVFQSIFLSIQLGMDKNIYIHPEKGVYISQ